MDDKTVEQQAAALKTNLEQGLTTQEANSRLKRYGHNTHGSSIGSSLARIFFEQCKDPLMYLLLGSGVIIFFTGEPFDAAIIFGIFLLTTLIGAFQEVRIAYIVDKVQHFGKQFITVIRDNKQQSVMETKLVVGDIMVLQAGNRVPADGQVIQAHDFSLNESILTGESRPVEKLDNSFVFSGSHVQFGFARVLITATGKATRMSALQESAQKIDTQMPLRKDLSHLLRLVLILVTLICVSLLITGIATGRPFGQILAAITALFVCVIPQGLPVIMSIALVSSAYRLTRHNIFVRRLQAIESLGRADIVVLDKTGTLTTHELMVTQVSAGGVLYQVTGKGYSRSGRILQNGNALDYEHAPQALQMLARVAYLLDQSKIQFGDVKQSCSINANPLEAALAAFAYKLNGAQKVVDGIGYTFVHEIPFAAEHRYHAAFFEQKGKGIMFAVGAPELIMDHASYVSEKDKEQLAQLLGQGLRVVAACYKSYDNATLVNKKDLVKRALENCTFVGLYALTDTLREDAASMIETLGKAGMRVAMATGDNYETALGIAQELGIATDATHATDGDTFRTAVGDARKKMLLNTTVYARMLPEDKLQLIRALQEEGNNVVMVGDGVNDAPALALAELAIAMGTTGTDIAKQTADIILREDSFEGIAHLIEHSRHLFLSFKRVILYFFTTNLSEIIVMIVAFVANWPLPLLASQILWINLVTDGFLDFSLAMEPYQGGLLDARWNDQQKRLISAPLIIRLICQSVIIAGIVLWIFYRYFSSNLPLARTMVLATLTASCWAMALNARSLDRSFFSLGLFSNRLLAAALPGIVLCLVLVIHTSWGQFLFQTVALSGKQWCLVGVVGASLFIAEEIRKWAATRVDGHQERG